MSAQEMLFWELTLPSLRDYTRHNVVFSSNRVVLYVHHAIMLFPLHVAGGWFGGN